MAQTQVRGTQVLNQSIGRDDVVTAVSGQAVVAKIVQGVGISLSSTGADSGTGDVTVRQILGSVYLGGSRSISVAPSPAAYTPVPDYLDFVAPWTMTGTVRADIWTRNAGVTVTAQLYNVTDATVTGTSSGVTQVTATEVTFAVSLVAGKRYRLRILASAAGEGVFGIGKFEGA